MSLVVHLEKCYIWVLRKIRINRKFRFVGAPGLGEFSNMGGSTSSQVRLAALLIG